MAVLSCQVVRLVPLAAFLFAVAWAAGSDDEEDEDVVTLTSSNFDNAIDKSERVFVEFYAPWCGHCKALEPEYKQAAKEMKAEGLSTVLAKVDATEESEVAGRYDIKGYPTLVYFTDGRKVQNYEGERTAQGIKAWLKKREKSDVQVVEATSGKQQEAPPDAGGYGTETKEGEFSVVGHVKLDSVRHKAFMKAANEHLLEFEAAIIRKAIFPLQKSADAKADARLIFFRPNFTAPDEPELVFNGSWTAGNIAKWIKASIYPTVFNKFQPAKLTSTILEDMGWSGYVAALVDDASLDKDEADQAIKQKMREQLVELAQAEKKWKFVVAEISETAESDLEKLGAKKSSLPMLSVIADGKKYVLAGNEMVKPGAAKDFLDKVKDKKVKPHFKSAKIPSPEVDENGVTVLVGETFETRVLDSKKDVFVKFYAPWCGHCQKLQPIWEELAMKSKENGWKDRGLVIAKMDLTENECDEQDTGYPKLVLYPAVKSNLKFKKKREYSAAARNLASLETFLFANAMNLEGVEAENVERIKLSLVKRELEKKRKQREF